MTSKNLARNGAGPIALPKGESKIVNNNVSRYQTLTREGRVAAVTAALRAVNLANQYRDAGTMTHVLNGLVLTDKKGESSRIDKVAQSQLKAWIAEYFYPELYFNKTKKGFEIRKKKPLDAPEFAIRFEKATATTFWQFSAEKDEKGEKSEKSNVQKLAGYLDKFNREGLPRNVQQAFSALQAALIDTLSEEQKKALDAARFMVLAAPLKDVKATSENKARVRKEASIKAKMLKKAASIATQADVVSEESKKALQEAMLQKEVA